MPARTSVELEALNLLPKMVAAASMDALSSNLGVLKTVNQDYSNEIALSGNVININLPRNFLVANLTEGTAVNMQNPAGNSLQITLDQHPDVSFDVTDLSKILTPANIIGADMEQVASNMGDYIEKAVLTELYTSATQNVGTFGTAITTTDPLINARKLLVKAKARAMNGAYTFMAHPDTYADLLKIDKLTTYELRGPNGSGGRYNDAAGNQNNAQGGLALSTGYLGRAYALDLFESQNVIQTGTTTVQTHNMAYHKDALLFVSRTLPTAIPGMGVIQEIIPSRDGLPPMRLTMWYDGNFKATKMSLDCLFGTGAGRDKFAVEVRS